MNIDLTKYVIASASWGPWLKDKDAFTASELRLGDPLDGVTLAGPLRVRVSVQARNHFTHFAASATALQTRDVYSYMLDIPPGQTWTYPAPRALGIGEAPVLTAQPTVSTLSTSAASIGTAAPAASSFPSAASIGTAAPAASPFREVLWGANAGFGISIRAAGADVCADPCAAVDPCAPKPTDCHCGGRCGSDCSCSCHDAPGDLPCDFATGKGSHAGTFFPAACEPCAPGAFVGMPPVKGPSLVVPAARGGTTRTRYFNGMFITREDLSTDQNNNRIKHALMNRAMGQGVVWGLNVALENNAICVWPGYGVDCCGNDILISLPYRVDADALVRDPAAARTIATAAAQHRRMNLLLEYFECPEEPRPVHGDPCAPDSVSCEMSRTRETARLRLIPPCDVNDSGPIKDFLDAMQKLRGDAIVGPMLAGAPGTSSAVAVQVPFTVNVEGLDAVGVVGSVALAPKLMTDPAPGVVSGDAKGVPNRSMMTRARVTVTAKSGFQLAAGEVTKQSPPGLLTPTKTATSISWEDDIPEPVNSQLTYVVGNWRFQAAGGSLTSSGTVIKLTKLPAQGLRMRLHVDIDPSNVSATGTQPPTFPCAAEACDPDGRPRFPVPLPWLHENPGRPGQAADPLVIVIAIIYAVAVTRTASNGAALGADALAELKTLANALNVVAWKLVYGDLPSDSQADVIEALQRLLQAWCKALLYPGPKCECGCDPHGVVIGCAVVQGGRITMVDPWGGRRWVVHYPLIAYWGKQFGIMPFDAIASKFFDLICCISQSSPPRKDTGVVIGAAAPLSAVPAAATPVVPIGASALFLDQPANIPARLAELGVAVDRTVVVGPAEFISHVVGALNKPLEPRVAARAVLYTVAGLPELNFVAPDPEAQLSPAPPGPPPSPAPTPSPATTPSPAPAPTAPARLATIVRSAIAARPARTAIPLLLRDMTEALTRDLLHAIAPEPATDAGRLVRDALAGAGITSVAALLDAHPEDLHVDVLNRRNAEGLAALLDVSEKTVAATARAVGNAVVKFSSARRITARDDLRQLDVAADFSSALTAALKETVSPEYVAEAVGRAAGPLH